MGDLEARAKAFATAAHERVGQKRKYTGEPYITHPAAVVEIVRSVSPTAEMLAAAWLHDTVEDTGVKLQEISDLFGGMVGYYVSCLSDVSKPEDGDREKRKAIDRKHTWLSSPSAKTIKLADLIDNSKNILERDPDFARVYLAEKQLLLEVLREGNDSLWEQANAFIDGSKRQQAKDDKDLRDGAKELIQSLKGLGVRGDQKQSERYSAAFDKVARVLGLEPATQSVKVVGRK